jgi:hypothetical protein
MYVCMYVCVYVCMEPGTSPGLYTLLGRWTVSVSARGKTQEIRIRSSRLGLA